MGMKTEAMFILRNRIAFATSCGFAGQQQSFIGPDL
jgi:hypothetical protein